MADPNPNKALIMGIDRRLPHRTPGQGSPYNHNGRPTVYSVHAVEMHGISEFINRFQALNGINDQTDKACIIDYCLRHGEKQLKCHIRNVAIMRTPSTTHNARTHTTTQPHTHTRLSHTQRSPSIM
jgi:hypothetical protein